MNILIIDDQKIIMDDLEEEIKLLGEHNVVKGSDISEAKKLINENTFEQAIIDLKLDNTQDYGGIEVLAMLKEKHPESGYILLSGYALKDIEDELTKLIDQNAILKQTIIKEELAEHYVYKQGGDEDYIDTVLRKLGLTNS